MDSGASHDDIIEEGYDVGGPAMINSMIKNHAGGTVVVEPDDYDELLTDLQLHDGVVSQGLRERLALKAINLILADAAAKAAYFQARYGKDGFGSTFIVAGKLVKTLRYGENPHQSAAIYATRQVGLATAQKLQGKELSYNNNLDADAALACARNFPSDEPACIIVKHNTPCGVAVNVNQTEAYRKARDCDSESAFGGVIAFNTTVTGETATEVCNLFCEVVLAPGFDEEALASFAEKPGLRIIKLLDWLQNPVTFRSINGGFMVQTADTDPSVDFDQPGFKVMTKRGPSLYELEAIKFAWRVTRDVKSNAIAISNAHRTLGIGGGQTKRVRSAELAVQAMRELDLKVTNVIVAGSDAFFPFRDGLDVLAKAGVTAIIQPGGSVRDDEVIAAANEHDMAMVFTGIRHFRH